MAAARFEIYPKIVVTIEVADETKLPAVRAAIMTMLDNNIPNWKNTIRDRLKVLAAQHPNVKVVSVHYHLTTSSIDEAVS